jgi:hypothetical protein
MPVAQMPAAVGLFRGPENVGESLEGSRLERVKGFEPSLGPGSHPDRASGGASTAIVAVMNLETRYEAPHFEDPPEQPCGQNGQAATTRCEAEPTQG